jgi:hypothetical protein
VGVSSCVLLPSVQGMPIKNWHDYGGHMGMARAHVEVLSWPG